MSVRALLGLACLWAVVADGASPRIRIVTTEEPQGSRISVEFATDDPGAPLDVDTLRVVVNGANWTARFESTSRQAVACKLKARDLSHARLRIEASIQDKNGRLATASATFERVQDVPPHLAGSLTGRVLDELGRPVRSFALALDRGEPGSLSTHTRATSDGRFRLDRLPEGRYRAEVRAPGHAARALAGVEVLAGRTTDLGHVRLERGRVVDGAVEDHLGTGVQGATVWLGTADGTDLKTVTAADGRFRFRNVPSGPGTVAATHSGFAGSDLTTLEQAEDGGGVRLVLHHGGRLEGRAPGTASKIRVVSPLPPWPPANTERETRISGEGTFVFDALPTGAMRVLLLGEEGGAPTQEKEVEIREGETAVVDFTDVRPILVSGRVTESGQPLVGGRVVVSGRVSPEQPPSLSPATAFFAGLTGEEGHYVLRVPGSGDYAARVESGDGSGGWPERVVSIPDGDTFQLDLAFAGIPLDGIVEERGTGTRIAGARVHATMPKGSYDVEAVSDGDGHFRLSLEPGEHLLTAWAEGYGQEGVPLIVGESQPTPLLRIEMIEGRRLGGRVVDAEGHGLGGVAVTARPADQAASGGSALTSHDGSFEIQGLTGRSYDLLSGGALGAFAARSGARPGDQGLSITLRPPGRVTLVVEDATGRAVEGAQARVTRVDGVAISMLTQAGDSHGQALLVPAGSLELQVAADGGSATVPLEVRPGEAVFARVTLVAAKAGGR